MFHSLMKMETKTSFWLPAQYSRSSQHQIKDAEVLIRQIIKDGAQNIKIIVDIGCGPGDATENLSKSIPHVKLFAVDIDPEMIFYAKSKDNDGKIQYLTQDIGVPWEKLDEKLKVLEGTVDIVVSNYVLHWVKDKETAVETISRLLKPGGRLYANIVLFRDPFEFSEEHRNRYTHLYQVKSHAQQIQFFKSVFEKNEVSLIRSDVLEKYWSYDSEAEYEIMMSGIANVWETMIRPMAMKQYVKETKQMIEVMRANTKNITGHPFRYNNTIKPVPMKHYFELFRVFGKKN